MANPRPRAVLYLKNGARFDGFAFGASGEVMAEVVFNTSMTGYQEILTDPSYAGQMVTLTYPLIGNYGTRRLDEQADGPKAAALIIRELAALDSNFQSEEPLEEYLKRYGIVGIDGIDTRRLVLTLRQVGCMNGILSTVDLDSASLQSKVDAFPSMEGLDLVKDVTIKRAYEFSPKEDYPRRKGAKPLHVAVIDCGVKRNILELMAAQNFNLTVLPAHATSEEILALKPDGVFASNGPGDPAAVTYTIDAVKGLLGKVPIFGICLGHQIMGLALGAKTYKLKFGHRGGNHPVRDEMTKRIEITAQNHGFCVDAKTLPEDSEPTHWNLNDLTLEGFRHKKLPAFCVQYHPEASPGPHDSAYLFERFREVIERGKT
ncbi:glutamine-hydrolyzing carbamoyl-phosphate synthase small subunit [Candidatus Sumerlaeota bacterium]|nr:glutamine-hydrolyzing carbamoyl-phosphate synthase small subunit [Candidatus Sumerlaeota bacterium]MBI3736459.1 glutamine-hydrolyzing carbamoyl-phosphate synthase small subunit [Candidatus Sumerlaeota bacterium]